MKTLLVTDLSVSGALIKDNDLPIRGKFKNFLSDTSSCQRSTNYGHMVVLSVLLLPYSVIVIDQTDWTGDSLALW